MALKAGIVGLPNVGKSSLFSALTKKEAESANYAFTTIEPNVASVELIDPRMIKLTQMAQPNKTVYATFDFVDIAGLVEGASKGEGLGNKFLANIRETDAIVHVIRCFENNDILHVKGSIDSVRDAKIINLELILADLTTVENIINRVKSKALNSSDKKAKAEYALALKMQKALMDEKPLRLIEWDENELFLVKSFQLLTIKPQIYVANLNSEEINDPSQNLHYQNLEKLAAEENSQLLALSVNVEKELVLMENESEKLEMMQMFNLEFSGLDLLVARTFKLLNLATFFTVGKIEVRAWIFKNGMLAPQCAGIIHSDFENKFIKAEVISYDDFVEAGGEAQAKEKGKLRLEGKNYLMQDGDICHFRFGK
ncbi:redox-regulated ATPase YchF [Mycoplasmopsis agassizii]|uniref:redox-regulated ATPase YchF n=1 Tax=Mycoplasmopsis agassizii TaxID=33922 RepID=UPI003528EBB2